MKMSFKHVLKMSWRHLENILRAPWRRLQRNNVLSSKTSSPRVWKMSSEDVLKTTCFKITCLLGFIFHQALTREKSNQKFLKNIEVDDFICKSWPSCLFDPSISTTLNLRWQSHSHYKWDENERKQYSHILVWKHFHYFRSGVSRSISRVLRDANVW